MKWIDRAETRFGHIAIPHLVQAIGILSGAVFYFYKLDPHYLGLLDLYPDRVMAGEAWRLVTYIFIPGTRSFLLPLPDWVNAAFYVLFIVWMGNGLEQEWGAFRVNLYCLATMVGITVAAFFFGSVFSSFMFVQALFFAFARLYPDQEIFVSFILPVKLKWLAWVDAAWLVFLSLSQGISFTMAALAALSAYFLFFGKEMFQAAKLRQEVSSRRGRFESAARVHGGDAMHECAVCKRTEFTAPDLDFRVAKDGSEYCLEHLPKPSSPAPSDRNANA